VGRAYAVSLFVEVGRCWFWIPIEYALWLLCLASIEYLQQAFRTDCVVPVRQVATMPGGKGERLFFSMPAFAREGGAAVKNW
jgi:hypothetical protein